MIYIPNNNESKDADLEDEGEGIVIPPTGMGGMTFSPDLDDPRDTFTNNPAYNQSVSKTQLTKTYFGTRDAISAIRKSALMPDTKEILITISKGIFDKTEVLAKTSSVDLEVINVEIILAQARMSFHPVDVDNPDLSNIINLMRHHYGAYKSRSLGGWERGLQNIVESSQSSTQRIIQDVGSAGVGKKSDKAWYNPSRWL